MCLVYFVDSNAVAKKKDRERFWVDIRKAIDMDKEEIGKRSLGCRYTNFTATAASVLDLLKQDPSYHKRPQLKKEDCNGEAPDWVIDPKRIVTGKTYDMKDFVEQCGDSLCELAEVQNKSLERAKNFILGESKGPKDWEIFAEKGLWQRR